MCNRDPFSSPRPENDFSLSGFTRRRTRTYDKPTHIAQTEEPWCRLHDAATQASSRRSVMDNEHEAPSDSLDFLLQSVYDHHKDSFWTKNQTFHQKETLSNDKLIQEKQDTPETEQENDIRRWVDPQRCSIDSIK